MGFYYKDSEIVGKRGPIGPAGPDGNAIGTIVSFMGTSAPDGYLICDGAVYNIADYSDLSDFFLEQFGSKNYFGGDGTLTFSVPDLRNLFLRGYHGESSEQLSGEIGEKQEATQHVSVDVNIHGTLYQSLDSRNEVITPNNIDQIKTTRSRYSYFTQTNLINQVDDTPVLYTSRPANTAVLFCIKYLKPKTALVGGGISEAEADEKYATKEYVDQNFLSTTKLTQEQVNLGYGSESAVFTQALDTSVEIDGDDSSEEEVDPEEIVIWDVVKVNGHASFSQDVTISGNKLRNVARPTHSNDAATKEYVDEQIILNTSAGPSGDQNVYSTEEVIVGTWVDGKPIYRKVFQPSLSFETIDPSDYNGVDINIAGYAIETVIGYRAICMTSNNSSYQSYTYLTSENVMHNSVGDIRINVTESNIVFRIYNATAQIKYYKNASIIIEYVKTDVLEPIEDLT